MHLLFTLIHNLNFFCYISENISICVCVIQKKIANLHFLSQSKKTQVR